MLKIKIRYIVLILICAATIAVTAVLYYQFTQSHIFYESKAHLGEIYNQTNAIFGTTVENNRKLLLSWDSYVETSVNNINTDNANSEKYKTDLKNYIESQCNIWDVDDNAFSDFYFIGQESVDNSPNSTAAYKNTVVCKPLSGDSVTLRTHRKLSDFLQNNEKGGVVAIRDGETSKHMLFAVAVNTTNTYEGFSYNAIGFSLSEAKILSILSKDAYNGSGQFCLALPNGDVLMKTDSAHKVTNVFQHFIDDNVTISDSSIPDMKKDWDISNQVNNTVAIEENGNSFYFSYRPVGFGGWMLVGIISTAAVNSNMNKFSAVTIGVMAAIFCVIASAVIILIVSANRQRIKDKTIEITLRENLLDTLSVNSKDIFVTFSGSTFKSDYVSSNINRVLGLNIDAVKQDMRTLLDACTDDIKPFTTDGLKLLPIGESWSTDIKLKHITEDIRYFYHLTINHCIVNGDDTYIMMLSDRTTDKNMRDKLEDALNIAKSANKAKSNFLSNMSHDIRTPMNAIIGYSTLLAKDAENAERVRDYTRKITYSGQHLLGLINDILDMSKIESGKTSLNVEEFSLPEFIEELYSIMASQANAKKLKFDVHTKGTLPEYVLGDKLRLNRVILNILSNAIKYTPHGGSVELKIEALNQTVHNHAHIKFTVTDTGIGMSQEYIKTIFEPFSRENSSEAKAVQGTGLGMAIAKNIVDLMGGVISVESTLGKGSVFSVELELAVVNGLPDEENFWQHHNVTRLLVVDDEEDICMDIKELMSDTGVEIRYALSGEQAVEDVKSAIANKETINIVLLDWKMPGGIDGVETAKRIRAIVGRELPIMVLTSYSFEDIEEEAKAAGIDLFMSKPFFVSNFKRAVMQIGGNGVAAEVEPPESDISLQGLKVLAAEDNAINAEILVELLDIEGVKCDVAVNGKEASEIFEASEPGKYDMIFMDIQMPIMNGYETARAIRACNHKNAKTIPIIAMTANAFDTDVKAALDAGMNAHMAKPINMTTLKQTIAKVRKKIAAADGNAVTPQKKPAKKRK